MALGAQRPEIAFIVRTAELQRHTVIKLAVIKVNYSLAHAAMTTIALVNPALHPNPCTSTNAALLAIGWLNAPGFYHFKSGL